MRRRRQILSFAPVWVAAALGLAAAAGGAEVRLLNVSYDVTREFFQDYNPLFAAFWKEKTGDVVVVNQSHGGSSKQARAVMDGLEADVVTMNQPLDIDLIQERAHLIAPDWASRFPGQSAPYHSTILFLVRRGNPKKIHDWDDLVRPGISVILPNPKTSGNGRYSYLAAWGYALRTSGGKEASAREFVRALFANVPVLDAGGRGATTTFVQRDLGDVLLTFENEAALTLKEAAGSHLELVVPSVSIRADSPVTWVDAVVSKHQTESVARAYLDFLYSDAGQELAAKHFFRPHNPEILARHGRQFKSLALFTVAEIAGNWRQAQRVHFTEGGLFDQIARR